MVLVVAAGAEKFWGALSRSLDFRLCCFVWNLPMVGRATELEVLLSRILKPCARGSDGVRLAAKQDYTAFKETITLCYQRPQIRGSLARQAVEHVERLTRREASAGKDQLEDIS